MDKFAEEYKKNPRPRRLGYYYCYMYDRYNQPWIVIGPDYWYSIVELLLMNGFSGACIGFLMKADDHTISSAGCLLLLLHNLFFMLTVCWNPGLPNRDLNSHSKSHLNKAR